VIAPGELSNAVLAGWFTNWFWVAGPLSIALTLQLFPDGQVVGPRWRLAVWITVIGCVLAALGAAFVPGRLNNVETIDNPFGWEVLSGLTAGVFPFAGLFELVAFGLGFASVAVRFRRSRGIERLQLKWLAYAGSLLPVVAVVNSGIPIFGSWGLLAAWIAIYAVPIAIGVAVMRYRLYEIDLLIRRTLIYAVLTAGLGAVYWASVVVLQQALRPFTQGSELAVVGSTLAVAALFQPARGKIQQAVDLRFYRRKYDAARTLDAFSSRLREDIDLDNLQSELLAVVNQTMQPAQTSLWLRRPE
jgi:hypothetical protein